MQLKISAFIKFSSCTYLVYMYLWQRVDCPCRPGRPLRQTQLRLGFQLQRGRKTMYTQFKFSTIQIRPWCCNFAIQSTISNARKAEHAASIGTRFLRYAILNKSRMFVSVYIRPVQIGGTKVLFLHRLSLG